MFDVLKDTLQVSEPLLLEAISKKLNIPFKPIAELVVDECVKNNKIQLSKFEKSLMVPIFEDNKGLLVAINNPFSRLINKVESLVAPKKVGIVLVVKEDIDSYWGLQKDEGSSVTVLDKIILKAIAKKASDIHINSIDDAVCISFRVNGEMQPVCEYKKELVIKLKSLLKLHSHMDISVSNKPQDGRMSFKLDGLDFDIRVSSLPTIYGEDFVLRLFNEDGFNRGLLDLGFSKKALSMIFSFLKKESGLILVTGPTGSGKTTTLYSFLNYLVANYKKNIVSIEDPVEAVIKGVRQSQTNAAIGYDFCSALRSVLRQDPDIIMIGEIRDRETAKIALEAAYTGHLVLATLHTSDIRSTLLRLANFDLDPFLVMNSLKGVVSQKLGLRLCQCCRAYDEVEGKYIANGCKSCSYTGIDGRLVISEVLGVKDKKIREDFSLDIEKWVEENDYYSFEEDMVEKFGLGIYKNP